MSKSYHIETYGCQMNVADSELVSAMLQKAGYHETVDIEKADAIFVTSAATGIRSVERIEATKLPSNKLVTDLKNAYENELTKHAILAAKSTST